MPLTKDLRTMSEIQLSASECRSLDGMESSGLESLEHGVWSVLVELNLELRPKFIR